MSKCEFCQKSIENKGSLAAHVKCCQANPDRVKRNRSSLAGQKKGCVPWNKNKTFKEQKLNHLIEVIESGKYKTHSENSIRRLVRAYLVEKHGHKCMMCGLTHWKDVLIPLVSDHIDGNHKNNNLSNFRIICNNCDSILPTYKGKNRGNGRSDRYE
jgi:hypothetical protein